MKKLNGNFKKLLGLGAVALAANALAKKPETELNSEDQNLFGLTGLGLESEAPNTPLDPNLFEYLKSDPRILAFFKASKDNAKLETVNSIDGLINYTGSNFALFDGSTWEKKEGDKQSNGGGYAGTIVRVSEYFYWERNIDLNIKSKYFGINGVGDESVKFWLLNQAATALNYSLELCSNINISQTYNISQSINGNGFEIKLSDGSSITNGNSVFNISNNNVSLKNFVLNGNRINNPGLYNNGILGIRADNKSGLKIDNVIIKNTRHVGLLVTNCKYFSWKNSKIIDCGRFGLEAPAAQWDRIGALIDNSGTGLYMGKESVIDNIEVQGCGLDGLVLGVGISLKNSVFFNNGVEFVEHNDGAAGVYVRPPQNIDNAIIDGLTIENCVSYNNSGLGIDVGNNIGSTRSPSLTNITIKGNICYSNRLCGIGVASTKNTFVYNNTCYNNGTLVTLPETSTANNRRAGIYVDALINMPFYNLNIFDNLCYDSSSSLKTQKYGILLGNGNSSYSSTVLNIYNNNLVGNLTKPLESLFSGAVVPYDSQLNISKNTGVYSFTLFPVTGLKLVPMSSVLYVSHTGITVTGIGLSVIGNIITIENISASNLTLLNNFDFVMKTGANVVLSQNQKATFLQNFKTGNPIWEQIL
jgi:hypothetical protein